MAEKLQVVILAGGLGTRLKPLTNTIPKAMVLVRGRPFISYLLDFLRGGGVGEVVLTIGYRGEQIKKYVGNGSQWELKVTYSDQGSLPGTGGAMNSARPFLKEWFAMLYGDVYLPIDLRQMVSTFLSQNKTALMAVYGNRINTGVPNNLLVENGVVVKYEKDKLDPNLNYVDAGITIMWRRALELLPLDESSLERAVYSGLAKERQLQAYISQHRFFDIGTLCGLRELENYFDY